MSELLNNSTQRKEVLKHLLLQLHEGAPAEILRKRLIEVLSGIPYNEVVEVEQELINDGMLTHDEILDFCDLHTAVLEGSIDLEGAKSIPAGHPVDTFKKENVAILNEVNKAFKLFDEAKKQTPETVGEYIINIHAIFNTLSDIDKHYKRKEYLVFPYLEQHEITGPPKVMWGKHDEIRGLLKDVFETLNTSGIAVEELPTIIDMVFTPVLELIEGMVMKEEEILLPMTMDTLSSEEWFKIYQETPEFGYCIVDTDSVWKPDEAEAQQATFIQSDAIRLSSGAFNMQELEALFIHLPIDITFVDKNDKVRFFSHSPNRVFERNRSVIGRDVRMCHPPGSVHIVEQILEDFKSGKENKAVFWISNFMGNRFVYIEYSAVRNPDGDYLGVVEVTQDITKIKKLEGNQRLLSYSEK